MLILLNKKIRQYYRIAPEEIPPEVYSPEGMKNMLFTQYYLYDVDYINNVNVLPEIVNVKHVKQFAVFNYNDEFRGISDNEYLKGSNTKITFNDNSIIYVTETLNEIAKKTGVIQ